MYGQLSQYMNMLDTAGTAFHFEHVDRERTRVKVVTEDVIAVFERDSGNMLQVRAKDPYGEDS